MAKRVFWWDGRVMGIGVPVLSCALAVPAVGAQTLGRLFSSVEQRLELDEIRDEYEYGKPVKPAARERGAEADASPKGAKVPQVTVNGLVLRSSGVNASWVNGAGIFAGETTVEGIRIVTRPGDQSGAVRLVLPSGADTAPLKPGQKIDVLKGQVVDTYTLPRTEPDETRLFGSLGAKRDAPPMHRPSDPPTRAPGTAPGEEGAASAGAPPLAHSRH